VVFEISLRFMESVMSVVMRMAVSHRQSCRAQVAFRAPLRRRLSWKVIRGGLQAGQWDNTRRPDALGLSYWQKNGLIILPQAIRHVIPPLSETFIALLQRRPVLVMISSSRHADDSDDRHHRSRLAVVQRRGLTSRGD